MSCPQMVLSQNASYRTSLIVPCWVLRGAEIHIQEEFAGMECSNTQFHHLWVVDRIAMKQQPIGSKVTKFTKCSNSGNAGHRKPEGDDIVR